MTVMTSVPSRAAATAPLLPVLLFAMAGAAGCDIAMADFKQQETAQWRKTYELKPGARVEINNVNGKIDVQPAAGNTLEVVADKIAKGATSEAARAALARAEIHEDASPSGVRIETKLDRSGGLFNQGAVEVRYT